MPTFEKIRIGSGYMLKGMTLNRSLVENEVNVFLVRFSQISLRNLIAFTSDKFIVSFISSRNKN